MQPDGSFNLNFPLQPAPGTAPAAPARLETMVRELARPEGRRVGQPGHRVAEEWIRNQLTRLQLMPYVGSSFALPYTMDGTAFTNFAGVIPGWDRSLPPLLIGAHYDSVIDAPCADDNAASVALTLDVAARLQPGVLRRDAIIAFFDAEEPPYFQSPSMGSIRFYEDQTDGRGFHAAVISDLIGHDIGETGRTPDPIRRLVCILGAESHPGLPAIIEATPLPAPDNGSLAPEINLIALLNAYAPDLSDHTIFRQNGHPYLFLSCGQWRHYHQPSDTPDRLNYQKLAALTDWTCALVVNLADADLPSSEVQAASDPTEAFEASTLRHALPPEMLDRLGFAPPTTRADISQLVRRLKDELFT